MRDNIALAAQLFRDTQAHEEIEACTHNLSITTFRYVPRDLQPGDGAVDRYLNELNTALLAKLKSGGEVYVSNAIVDGKYMLRACIVNFRTTSRDVAAVPTLVARVGRDVDDALRPAELRR
jgi:glutamate/tyrosine decarboxylase-like PLP-dependent enzyme